MLLQVLTETMIFEDEVETTLSAVLRVMTSSMVRTVMTSSLAAETMTGSTVLTE
jgi:hypothetical protein